MKDKKNVNLEHYSKEYPPVQAVPHLVKEEQNDYNAVEVYNRGKYPRFRIIDADGMTYGCSYAHLIRWVFTPPSLLSIQLSSETFTFEGEEMHKIERLLLEEKIKELRVFNEQRYKKPAKGQAIITNLTLHSHAI